MSTPGLNQEGKALLLYDGECRFCCKWVARWKESGEGIIETASSQSGAGEQFGFASDQPLGAVQLIEGNGTIRSGAAAVFRLMAMCGSFYGGAAWWVYQHLGIFRVITEWGYHMVAEHRSLFSFLTTLLWGGNVCKPSYELASKVFLRLLALTYLAAFGGLWWQINGLVGPSGILPAGEFLQRAHDVLGMDAYRELPTLFWITGCSTIALTLVCAGGSAIAFAALIAWGRYRQMLGPFFLLLEILYLSLVNVGQIFMGYQWDALLLEAGFLAVFLAPWPSCREVPWRTSRAITTASRWLLIWLLFRLMLSSALVKWLSGDPSWHHLSALEYHFWTQPLPTPGGWLAGQLPVAVLRLMTLGMFVIEFGAPWLLFGPRNLRLLGAGMIAFLQVLIALTGNYGFFNLLTLALCVLAVDDHSWPRFRPRFLPEQMKERGSVSLPALSFSPGKIVILLCSLFLVLISVVPMPLLPRPALILSAYELLEPLHIVNGYGLFAVMTKHRFEIIVEGSDDGIVWKPYTFCFKPGDLHRPPPWVPFLMPRLDWQMWFAALGPASESPWFGNFIVRLFQSDRAVLDLLAGDPFNGKPPRFLRARRESYHFSTLQELRNDGLWWTSKPKTDYLPEVEWKPSEAR